MRLKDHICISFSFASVFWNALIQAFGIIERVDFKFGYQMKFDMVVQTKFSNRI